MKRRESEERMDTLFAPIYDQDWGAVIDPIHRRFVTSIAAACPPGGSILDAACGTGKYWPILLEYGCDLTGIDQSQGMLAQAKAKYPQVPVEKTGLQEMQYQAAFDIIVCIDAMEYIFPEDWPRVMDNLYRTLKSPGQLYFTVELPDAAEVKAEYRAGLVLGLPVLPGEAGVGGGYHYYPPIEQVREWIREVHFSIREEAVSDLYHHFWVSKA